MHETRCNCSCDGCCHLIMLIIPCLGSLASSACCVLRQHSVILGHACHGTLHASVTLLLVIVTPTYIVGCGVYSVHSIAVSCVRTKGSATDVANSSGIAHGLRELKCFRVSSITSSCRVYCVLGGINLASSKLF